MRVLAAASGLRLDLDVGGVEGLFEKVRQSPLTGAGLDTWSHTASTDNPLGANWIGMLLWLRLNPPEPPPAPPEDGPPGD